MIRNKKILIAGTGFASALAMKLANEQSVEVASIEDASISEIKKTAKQLDVIMADSSFKDYNLNLTLPPVYGAEKKRKKPCKRHEYVQQSHNEQLAHGSLIKAGWRCRHCNHPLN